MNAQRWAVIESLYHAALAKEPGERSSYVAAACAEDSTLRSELESLLACAEARLSSPAGRAEVAKLWEQIAESAVAGAVTASPEIERCVSLPPIIGRYRILRRLGEGGMGTVYEAEQEHPLRTVALKVIKPGLAGPELLRRFEQESQALARLQHPGIAQIYEGGTADSGCGLQPYFAMEFIRGESLLQYAEAHQLNTRQRLELIAKVCEAVHHAHQRGIIHRDLKPGNILVDESGQPKILDFGVARATNSDARATRQTDLGQLVGTLAYMSPEQVLADPLELDTRSDVYALGVILYELLAGRSPYKISRQLHEAVQTIREQDPAPLSSISRNYRGDIETIVSKALEKDKARRYASAAGMAADIQRYLKDEPIAARPPSATYQLQKFARRHKALVAGVVAVFLVLIAGIIASTWQATRARRAEEAATTQAATAEAVNDFLQNDMLAQASAYNQSGPSAKPNPHLEVRTALDRAASRIAGKFDQQPEVEAAIRDTIGQTYMDIGVYPEARTQLERALDLHRRVLGAKDIKSLKIMSRLGRIAELQGKYPEAESLLSQTLALQRQVLRHDHPDTLYSMNNLATVYEAEGKHAQAEALHSQTLEIRRRVLGPEHPDTLASMSDLANVYEEEGKHAQAQALFGQTLEIRRRVLGTEHPDTLASMNNLANAYEAVGKYAQAEALYTQILGVARRVLGPDHAHTLIYMDNLARNYAEQAKYVQAEALFSKTIQISSRVRGPEHVFTLWVVSDIASMYQRQSKYPLAETYAAQALTGRRHALGSEDRDTMASAADVALAYVSKGEFADSEPLAREALDFDRKKQPDHWQRYRAESLLGAGLAGQKKYAEAEPLLLEGYQGMHARKDRIDVPDWYHLDRAREWIVQLYQAWGKPGKAAEWSNASR